MMWSSRGWPRLAFLVVELMGLVLAFEALASVESLAPCSPGAGAWQALKDFIGAALVDVIKLIGVPVAVLLWSFLKLWPLWLLVVFVWWVFMFSVCIYGFWHERSNGWPEHGGWKRTLLGTVGMFALVTLLAYIGAGAVVGGGHASWVTENDAGDVVSAVWNW